MKELVFVNNNNEVVTDSLMVAEVFGKEHKVVLNAIRTLNCSGEFRRNNFMLSTYVNQQNKDMPKYLIKKDGIAFLVMGFTGETASKFKEEYINAFNRMEDRIKKSEVFRTPTNYLEAMKECVRLEETRLQLETKIEEDRPKVEYHDRVLESESTYTVTQIAKEFGMSGRKLNDILKECGIQFKVGGQWVLRAKHCNEGYTDTRTVDIDFNKTTMQTRWTEKGRKFIHSLIDSYNQQSSDLA